jgi:integrase/recombinase XerC
MPGYFDLLTQFEQFMRVERNLSERTRNAYIYDLNRFQEYLARVMGRVARPGQISTDAIREYLNHLQVELGYKSSTLARVISSIRVFFDFCVDRGAIESSPAARIHTPKQPRKLPIYLVYHELVSLLQAPPEDTPGGLRDRTILTMLAFTGMRLSELTGVNLGDIDLVNRTVRVLGKGNKERIIPLNEIVMQSLNNWLNVRWLSDSNALILNRSGKRLSGRSVENIVRKWALKSGVFKDGISPHKLRHTFATLLHSNDVDLIEIKSLMGHANIASTQIYTHTTHHKLRKAVEKIENLSG